MHRTADRPLPSGKIASGSAFVIGWGLNAIGLFLLHVKVNGLAALFALLTVICYLALYTPAKRFSRWSTEIGAIAGAFPPLIGWAAAENHVSLLGWLLFGVLLFWQIPHFMAIAWTYRADYAAVNFPMLPVRDASGKTVARWSFANTVVVVGCAAAPGLLDLASPYYLGASAILGLWFIGRAFVFLRPEGRDIAAKKLFYASIIWLPLQLGALVADRLLFR